LSSEATIALLLSFAANGLWQEGHDFSKRLPNHPKKAQDSFIYTVAQRGHHAGCGYAVGEKGEEVHIQPITEPGA